MPIASRVSYSRNIGTVFTRSLSKNSELLAVD